MVKNYSTKSSVVSLGAPTIRRLDRQAVPFFYSTSARGVTIYLSFGLSSTNKNNFRRYASTAVPIVPIKIYKNADLDKPKIIKENKGKSGIYR